jgi:hypothetical protein
MKNIVCNYERKNKQQMFQKSYFLILQSCVLEFQMESKYMLKFRIENVMSLCIYFSVPVQATTEANQTPVST